MSTRVSSNRCRRCCVFRDPISVMNITLVRFGPSASLNPPSRSGRLVSLGARLAIATLLILLVSPRARADCDLDQLTGYTLVASKYISGYIENNERKDGFEGCNYHRIIVFDDNT